jgi:hypothetical protein
VQRDAFQHNFAFKNPSLSAIKKKIWFLNVLFS